MAVAAVPATGRTPTSTQPQTSHCPPDSSIKYKEHMRRLCHHHCIIWVKHTLKNIRSTRPRTGSLTALWIISTSKWRPVITTRGTVSDRINRQMPVGGSMQLSGVFYATVRGLAWDKKPNLCLVITCTYLRAVKSELTWYIQVWSASNAVWGVDLFYIFIAPCVCVWETETGCVWVCRHMRTALCACRRERVHRGERERRSACAHTLLLVKCRLFLLDVSYPHDNVMTMQCVNTWCTSHSMNILLMLLQSENILGTLSFMEICPLAWQTAVYECEWGNIIMCFE